jgi:transcriptional regulator with XRE-family HTH domain
MILRAYLASALTGLGASRAEILSIQERIEKACASHRVELYLPAKATDPVSHPDVPANVVFATDRRELLKRDFLILLTHVPSFGSGQEAQLASNSLMPILLISPVGGKVSRMLLGIPTLKYEVETDEAGFDEKLGEALDLIRPIAGSRRELISKLNKIGIGQRIKSLREERAISREEFADMVGVTAEEIASVEDEPVSISNPSVVMMRKIAEVLAVTLAEICDPLYVDAANSEIIRQLVHGVPLASLEYRDSKLGAYWRTVAPQDVQVVLRRILTHILERGLQ